MTASFLFQHVYTLVRQVPRGRVTTYGQVAQLAGTTPRVVGFALAALPEHSDVPWHRVVNRQGRISRRRTNEGALLQHELLRAEGITFRDDGSINLASCLPDHGEGACAPH
jgi:methylated-DNA-protein-cysteine methyltransferase-like protein